MNPISPIPNRIDALMTLSRFISQAALLELSSTTEALLLMRMTAAQASAITPADGMMLYTTDTDATFTAIGFWGYANGTWVQL